ncbi:MAG: hypothetical protein GEU86_03710 [Actinophytocola sp.]|nr:hypothetical protein [Actinophytocola sp.]
MVHNVRLRRFVRKHLPEAALTRLRAIRKGARAYTAALRTTRQAESKTKPKPKAAPPAKRPAPPETQIFSRLSRGEPIDAVAASTARELVQAERSTTAVSFADALASKPETATAGHLAAAVVAVHRRLPELAMTEFAAVPAGVWRANATAEYLSAAYRCDRPQAVAAIRQFVADRPDELGPQDFYEAVRYAFLSDELELANQAYTLLVERAAERPSAWEDAETEIAWLKPWMTRKRGVTAPRPPAGQVPVALIDYRQPGREKTSQNIGDHVQTLASLGHLVRHQNVSFHGPDELTEFVTEMQQQVRTERRLDSPPAEVALYTADRDASNYEAFPEGTWMLAFGWYMHPLFGVRHDFPMHPSLRPLFVSFHCNKREMLTDDAIEYLRRYGPIGCRDWTTVDLLLSLDVPAFFSGCLTTTVDTVFPPAERAAQPATVYVDVPPEQVPAGSDAVRHSYVAVKRRDFVRNMRDAVALLERYRREYTKVVTSRLHCYLPTRSLGLEVDFQPKSRADVRFNGLIDIDDIEFERIRTGMLARLETVMSAILAGKPESEVYELWRNACADVVAAARERHVAADPLPEPTLNIGEVVERVRGSMASMGPTFSDPVDVAVRLNAGDVDRLPRTLASLQAKASRPIRVWLLATGCGPDQHQRIRDAFPDLSVNWLSCDGSAADLRLLLLPELLRDLDRVTVLPPVAVVQGDIAELAGTDLGSHPIAARTTLGTRASSGFGRFYGAARRLHPDATAAHELFRRVHARHAFDFDAFDTEVIVADLARMRADRLTSGFLPYAERFGMTAAEVLTLYAGPDRAVLPPEWAHVPTNERVAEPQLVYWPGKAKPWQRRYVARRELWQQLATADPR